MKKITRDLWDEEDEDIEELFEESYSGTVTGLYGITSVTVKQARSGDTVVSYILRNRDGYMDAVHFNSRACREGDIVRVSGVPGMYNGRPQINISRIEVVEATEENIKAVLPVSSRPVEDIKKEIHALVQTFNDEWLSEFVLSLLEENSSFYTASAAKRMHHAWLGGLAEHSLSVAKIVSHLSDTYGCNRDIAIAGALLHDIGKIHEIESKGGFMYTDRGRLTGHSYIGASMIAEYVRDTRDPSRADTLRHIEHIILSHHGEPEYGAVVRPATKEALLVSLADKLDATMTRVKEYIETDSSDNGWTYYDPESKQAYRKYSAG